MTLIAIGVVAYLVGSLPFAVFVSRIFGLPDPRSYGSGNPGATNVLRTGRKAAAALTLAGDAAKGWIAVALAQWYSSPDLTALAAAIAAVAVTLGHMYSVFLRLRGGKGVATALGVTFALNVYVAAGACATWIIIAFFFRVSSLAALVTAVFVPFFAFFLHGMGGMDLPQAVALGVVALLVLWRHRSNIRNLIAGTEGRIGAGAPDTRNDRAPHAAGPEGDPGTRS